MMFMATYFELHDLFTRRTGQFMCLTLWRLQH